MTRDSIPNSCDVSLDINCPTDCCRHAKNKAWLLLSQAPTRQTRSGLKIIPAEQMKGIVGEFTREHSAWIVWLPIPSLHECKHQRVSLKGIGDKCFAFPSKGIPPRRGPIVKLGRDVDLIEVNPANAAATNSTVRVPDFLSRLSRTGYIYRDCASCFCFCFCFSAAARVAVVTFIGIAPSASASGSAPKTKHIHKGCNCMC